METTFTGSQITDYNDMAPGFSPVVRAQNALQERRAFAAAEVWADFQEGRLKSHYMTAAMSPNFQNDGGAFDYLCRRYPAVFRETMTTSDFTALTVDVLDRQLLADYTAAPNPVEPLVKKATLADFRLKKTFIFDGLETPFGVVNELQDLPLRDLSQRTPITYAPLKYEAGAKVSWEEIINDVLEQVAEKLRGNCDLREMDAYTGGYEGTIDVHLKLHGFDLAEVNTKIAVSAPATASGLNFR